MSALSRVTALAPNARDLQIVDSSLSVVGGDVHNHTHHHHYEQRKDVWMVLRSIPNFRQIYQDMLSKATPGTGMWLLKSDKFRVWLEPNGDLKIFWGSGIPGAGKTLLASLVIERLEAMSEESPVPICVCYFYFRYSESAEVTVRNVLEVFVKQTLERHPQCLALVEKTYARHIREATEPTEAQLLGLLSELISSMAATFYVLDAVDEASTKIQLSVVKTLASLNVKLFITSRPLEVVEAHFPEAHSFPIIARDADIDMHIRKEIDQRPHLQNLLRLAELREEIASIIKQNCGGMFLHASLQLDALCGCISPGQMRRTLKEFPPRIEDVYLQTWHRIFAQGQQAISLAKRVLVSVINAPRSMMIEELQRVAATCPDAYKLEPDEVVPGNTLIALCHGLVVVEAESKIVRLVHYTAKEPLQRLLTNTFPNPHSFLAAVCITRLVECGFQKTTITLKEELMATLENDPLLMYASEAWAFHARASMDDHKSKVRTAQFVTGSSAFPVLISTEFGLLLDIITPLHIVALYHLPLDLIANPGTGNPDITSGLWRQSPLIMAAQSSHESLVRFLIALPQIQVNMLDAYGWSALIWAARRGHTAIVTLLLAHRDIQVNLVSTSGWSALMEAARNGHEREAALLLAHDDVQVNLVDREGCSALIIASSFNHEGIVILLLAHPDIQINLVESNGWTALMTAARYGHTGIAKHLLDHHELQVNLVTTNGWSALMLAAGFEHEDIAMLLLTHPEIQVNITNREGWSALMAAARCGLERVVTLLLARSDIKVNLTTNDGWSALMVASRSGYESVVALLLQSPATQVNLLNSVGWSALTLAAAAGHEGIVARLVCYPGISVNAMGENGATPLVEALDGGHIGIVKRLLFVSDIDVNTIDEDGDTPIKLAAEYGQEAIVRMLLDVSELDITVRSSRDGHTAMSVALQRGNSGIVRLLQEFQSRETSQGRSTSHLKSPRKLTQQSMDANVDEDESLTVKAALVDFQPIVSTFGRVILTRFLGDFHQL